MLIFPSLCSVGIQYDTVQKELGDEVLTEGLHTGPPGYEFIVFPNVYTTLDYFKLRVSLCMSPCTLSGTGIAVVVYKS